MKSHAVQIESNPGFQQGCRHPIHHPGIQRSHVDSVQSAVPVRVLVGRIGRKATSLRGDLMAFYRGTAI